MRYPQVTSLRSDYPRLLLKCVPFGDYLVTRSVNQWSLSLWRKNSVSSVDSVRDKKTPWEKNTSEASKKICVNLTSDILCKHKISESKKGKNNQSDLCNLWEIKTSVGDKSSAINKK